MKTLIIAIGLLSFGEPGRVLGAEGVPAPQTASAPAKAGGGIPVRFQLDSASHVTVVIEDAVGNRVRNLIAETFLPAGENVVYWDGYDDGARTGRGELVRHRVDAAAYHVRSLTHDGIQMHYELTVNNPGTPPWATRDGTGGWLADHSPPGDILDLPERISAPNGKGPAAFLVCSTSAEAGSEFVWLDDAGRRLDGINDGFWGGTHLARDSGPNAERKYYAYVFESGQRDADNFTIEVRAFRADNGRIERIIRYPRPRSLRTFQGDEAYGCDGVAVRDGQLVMAVTMLNKLVFVDVRAKKVLGETAMASPRSPAFDFEGRLLVLSEGKVRRFRLEAGTAPSGEGEILIGSGLDDPRRMRIDAHGTIYISDWGRSHQVKVFDPTGKAVRVVGKPGGPQVGLYDEQQMAHPCGAAPDRQGRLWVAEGDFPKRVSVWGPDGAFVRAFYGPEKYGGGGMIDPRDRSRFYYEEGGNGIEFSIDWDTGVSRPQSVYWRPELMKEFETMRGWSAPERAFYAGNHLYLVNCYNGGLRFNQDRGVGIWLMDSNHVARPIAMIANAGDLLNGIWGWPTKNRDAILKLWQGKDPGQVLFVWSDRNGDGVAQPEEIQWVAEDHSATPGQGVGGIGLEPLVNPDLSFTTAYGLYVPPPQISPDGLLLYDLGKRSVIGDPREVRPPLVVGDRLLTHEDADASWVGFDRQGGKRWRYVATPEEQPASPGAMVSPTRLLGPAVRPVAGQAEAVVAINGEMGAIFLLTSDGLFIQTLGGDARALPPLSEPSPQRGWRPENFSFQQEHFHPTINQVSDGTIYLVAGFQQGTVLRLDGWGSIRRHDLGEVTVTPAELEGIPPTFTQSARKQGRETAVIPILSSPLELEVSITNWPPSAPWMRIDERASASAIVSGQRLYLVFRTGDPEALANAGDDARYLFKTGGALDLMLGTTGRGQRQRPSTGTGDLRLLVTRTKGSTRAVVYRATAPGSQLFDHVVYESPVGKVIFEKVRDISREVSLVQSGGTYVVSVPLETLGLKPTAGQEIRADVGILRGGEGRTMQRVYWNNLNTVIVSDLPSEARLQPGSWGVWKFAAETQK